MPELTEGELLNEELKLVLKKAGKTNASSTMRPADIVTAVLKDLDVKPESQECVEYSIRKLLLKYQIQERSDPGAVRYEKARFWFDESRNHENQTVDSTCGVASAVTARLSRGVPRASAEISTLAVSRSSVTLKELMIAVTLLHEEDILTDQQFIEAIKKLGGMEL